MSLAIKTASVTDESTMCCSICKEMLINCNIYMLNPCKHQFHYMCFNRWYKINPSCPECRTAVSEDIITTTPPVISLDDIEKYKQNIEYLKIKIEYFKNKLTNLNKILYETEIKNIEKYNSTANNLLNKFNANRLSSINIFNNAEYISFINYNELVKTEYISHLLPIYDLTKELTLLQYELDKVIFDYNICKIIKNNS